jgi:hypothetical protein
MVITSWRQNQQLSGTHLDGEDAAMGFGKCLLLLRRDAADYRYGVCRVRGLRRTATRSAGTEDHHFFQIGCFDQSGSVYRGLSR